MKINLNSLTQMKCMIIINKLNVDIILKLLGKNDKWINTFSIQVVGKIRSGY